MSESKPAIKIRVAVPDDPVYDPLVMHADSVCAEQNWELIRTNEDRCGELLQRNTAELALISPEDYGRAVGSVDYRIIAGPALMLEGYTHAASMYFRPGLEEIRSCAIAGPTNFLLRAGAIALGEKFQLGLEVEEHNEPVATLLQRFDAVIARSDDALPAALDVSEEWADLVGTPLPLMFWACRPDEMPENIGEIVASMAAARLPDQSAVTIDEGPEYEHRAGVIHWRWNDDFEQALAQCNELLFYLQYAPAMAAVKLFGRDPLE